MAELVRGLTTLRSEINTLAPNRDKASDGWIADAAHVAGGTSDHIGDESTSSMRSKDADSKNEVHAIDVDEDLRRAGWTMNRAVQIIVTRHRDGLDDRLQNVIYNRRIWSRSWGWTARAYVGANPHDKHAHFSARYTTAQENDTRPWGLLAAQAADDKEREVPFADDKIKVTATTGKELFDPDKPAGAEVEAATILQLAAIHARRAALSTDTLESTLAAMAIAQAERDAAMDQKLTVLADWFSKLNTPQASPEQTAALLRAALGSQAGPVGRILATFED